MRNRFVATAAVRVALALLVLVSACQARPMMLPADADDAQRMVVEGDGGWTGNSPFRFGAYEVDSIDRSWGRGSGVATSQGGVGGRRDAMAQDYAFVMRADGETVRVECASEVSAGTVDVQVVQIEASANASLDCNRRGGSGEPAWQLTLRSERGRPLAGILSFGSTTYDVRAQAREVVGNWQTSGYEVLSGGRVVAVVQTAAGSARFVWLAPALDGEERDAIATVAATMLVHRELEPDSDD